MYGRDESLTTYENSGERNAPFMVRAARMRTTLSAQRLRTKIVLFKTLYARTVREHLKIGSYRSMPNVVDESMDVAALSQEVDAIDLQGDRYQAVASQ